MPITAANALLSMTTTATTTIKPFNFTFETTTTTTTTTTLAAEIHHQQEQNNLTSLTYQRLLTTLSTTVEKTLALAPNPTITLPTPATNAFLYIAAAIGNNNNSTISSSSSGSNSINSTFATTTGIDVVSAAAASATAAAIAAIDAGVGSNDVIGTTTTTTATTTGTMSTTTEPSVNSYINSMAWPKAIIVATFLLLILVTVIGNTLVILAVLTTRRLRTVTNCFVMNLAITDWLVGTCVMPPSVIYYIVGGWRFGWILCDIWISLDVLLCTGSILSLCAISLDRYLAVTQPLTYSKKRRSKRLALFMIFIVWVTALSITCPPFLGWYDPGRREESSRQCHYNQNKGYVVFSAMGSFFIPLAVMLYVYVKIGYVLTSRRQRIVRDANSERTADHDIDCDNFISESEHFQCATPKFPSLKARWGISGSPHGAIGATTSTNGTGSMQNSSSSNDNSLKCSKCNKNFIDKSPALKHQPTFYELVEVSRLSSLIHCSAISCKYGGTCLHSNAVDVALGESRRASSLPMQALHYNDSQASFSETCLATAASAAAAAAASGGANKVATSLSSQNGKQSNHHAHPHQHANHHQHHHPHTHTHHQHQHHPHHPHPHHHHHHRIPMRVSTTKRDTKTAKTLTMVMGGFIACWLPFFVYYLLLPFLPPAAVFEGLMSFLTWVGWVNCAINPFIYAFYNPDFRTAFWRLTCRRICKQKPPPNHMAMFRG